MITSIQIHIFVVFNLEFLKKMRYSSRKDFFGDVLLNWQYIDIYYHF
jgi:hypothetical protein